MIVSPMLCAVEGLACSSARHCWAVRMLEIIFLPLRIRAFGISPLFHVKQSRFLPMSPRSDERDFKEIPICGCEFQTRLFWPIRREPSPGDRWPVSLHQTYSSEIRLQKTGLPLCRRAANIGPQRVEFPSTLDKSATTILLKLGREIFAPPLGSP
jgi:hypothetical protein